MAKKDLVRVIDNVKKAQSQTSFFTAGSGGGTIDTTNFLLLDGTRAMLANLDMGGFSVTNVNLLDGVDLATHVTLPDAHHATATPGTLISITGQQISLSSGSAQYQVPVTGASSFVPSWTSLSTFAGNGLIFSSGTFQVNPGDGIAIVTNFVKVKLPTNSGLVVDATGVYVGAGNGIQISTGTTSIKLATYSGMSFVSGGLQLDDGVAGIGLSINASRALSVNAGVGLDISGDNVILGMPSTIDTGTVSGASGTTHTHTLTWSPNPLQTSKILGTDGSGELILYRLQVTNRLQTPLINSATGANLTLQPAQRLTISPGANIAQITTGVSLQSDNYNSQLTGFSVKHDGSGDFRYLYVDEMHARAFIADLEQALAGGQIIAKSVTTLAQDWNTVARGSTTGTITVMDLPGMPNMAVFQNGDIIAVRTFSRTSTPGSLTIGDAYMTVSGYVDNPDGTQTWTLSRPASTGAGSGSLNSGDLVPKGTLVIDYGQSGNGFYEVNAIDGSYGANSPYMQIVDWTGHPKTGKNLRLRAGNLRGIFAGTDEYGLYIGSGATISYADAIAAPTTMSQYIRISNLAVEFHNIPTKWYKNFPIVGDTQTVDISSDGTMWFGKSSADKRFEFDGTNVKVKGSLLVGPGTGFATDALLYTAFDGSGMRGDYTGNFNGHLGQVAQIVGNPRFRTGKFGKALEVSQSVTNMVGNPSFESDTTDTGVMPSSWFSYGTGTNTGTREATAEDSWDGFKSLKIRRDSCDNVTNRYGAYYQLTVNTSYTYVVSAKVKVVRVQNPSGTSRAQVLASAVGGNQVIGTIDKENEWTTIKLKIQPTTTTLRVNIYTVNCDSCILYVDAVQVVEFQSSSVYYHVPYWGESGARGNSYVYYKGDKNVNLNFASFTAMGWIKLEDLGSNYSGNPRIFQAIVDSANRASLYISSSNKLSSYIAGQDVASPFSNGSKTLTGTTSITSDTWLHVALTIDGTTACIYLNGVLESTTTLTSTPRGRPDIYVGTTSSEYLNGLIDDFAIIGRPLSASEIEQIAIGNAPLRALSSPFDLRIGDMGAGNVWRELVANSGGIFGSLRDAAGAYTRVFSLLLDDITGTWAGISNPKAGDVIIGDASASASNYLYWDKTNSRLTINGSAMIKGSSAVTTSGAGLYLGSDKMGYYNGTMWKTWIKSDGSFYFGGTESGGTVTGARLQWNGSKLSGYSASAEQWYADASDGKLKFAGGDGIIDTNGITMKSYGGLTDVTAGFVSWYDTPSTRTGFAGSIRAGSLNLVGDSGMQFNIAGTIAFNVDLFVGDGAGSRYRIWHSGNDGAGSSLDAGYLGGYVYSDYPRLNTANTGYLQADRLVLSGGYIELAGSGGNDRVWRPGQQIAATNQGTYGPTLTYLANYNSGWKGLATGSPTAFGVTEGLLWFATGGSTTAGAAITWTNRLVVTATAATVTGNIVATGNVSGVNLSASGTLGVTGAATLSSTLGVTGRATLSDYLEVTKGIYITEVAATPPDPTNNAQLLMYVIGNKLVLAFKQSGVMRYFTIDLQATGTPSIVNNGSTAPS